MMMYVIIDYGVGNVQSIVNSFKRKGITAIISRDPSKIHQASGLILPGVGAFGDVMNAMDQLSLTDIIKQKAKEVPTLGICLGMQLFFEKSEETPDINGLGLVNGEVQNIPEKGVRIPHTGWNRLISKNIDFNTFGYFNHSYYCNPNDMSSILAYSIHGIKIPAIIEDNNILGIQFHPEKSRELGSVVLDYFINKVELGVFDQGGN
jgi:imidazole glycerol-phosphate synthase subunit HisH